jgi:hypothetical protein
MYETENLGLTGSLSPLVKAADATDCESALEGVEACAGITAEHKAETHDNNDIALTRRTCFITSLLGIFLTLRPETILSPFADKQTPIVKSLEVEADDVERKFVPISAKKYPGCVRIFYSALAPRATTSSKPLQKASLGWTRLSLNVSSAIKQPLH